KGLAHFAFCILHFELMEIPLDIWLRGDVHATSQVISVATREPGRWTDDDVTAVLVGMLRALEQAKNPEADENRQVAMRGFSWIVNPYDGGGVVIALELSLGAVVAGPFDVAERDLTAMIQRVMAAERAAMPNTGATVH
ncbi:MAG TPA: hypothetical protein VIZ32_21480, partial [Vicinamibacterales bacterium]